MTMRFGYTLMTEQSGPRELIDYAIAAEQRGFEFEVSSDHYSPWLMAQGHSPYAWSVLGAVAHATQHVDLYTFVTCPILRYHPAVVAQKAATLQLIAEGRFTLGLGSGENLNEHVVGAGWPAVDKRHDMFAEAIEIIRALHTGELTTWAGEHYRVDSARIWDMPDDGVELAIAVGGEQALERFAPLSDHLVATEPSADLVRGWNEAHGSRVIGQQARAIAQLPICWDPSEQAAIERAHEQFRWFAGGWAVNSDLPTPAGFAGAAQFVRPEDVAAQIPCGPDLDAIVQAAEPFWQAGFTDLALVQIGDQGQQRFLVEAAEPLLEKLRAASGSTSV